MTHYDESCRCPDGKAPGTGGSRRPANQRGTGADRVNLTPQEVAALLRGLNQGEAEGEAAGPAVSRPPTGLGRVERRRGLGLQKISHWWAAITELQWPQF